MQSLAEGLKINEAVVQAMDAERARQFDCGDGGQMEFVAAVGEDSLDQSRFVLVRRMKKHEGSRSPAKQGIT
jgi:hypothetical protein